MSSLVTIRRAQLNEIGLLSDLAMRSKRSNGYDDNFMEACREELTVTPERMAAGEYWVAEAHIICGCACLVENTEQHSGEVHAFFIDPDYQRQGIGKKLWLKILQSATSKGLTKLHLDADPAATSFYKSLGFVVVGKAPSGSIKDRMLPRMEFHLDYAQSDDSLGAPLGK